jgi:3-hydroxy-9,10-secoandrosta-1,3,5(10)-triene-9,17-dione monooxygenase reductase component
VAIDDASGRDELLDTSELRDALGRYATGVALVTAALDGEPIGLIVNSLTSVSLEPPLISFCPSRSSITWSRMRRARRFAVNVLGQHHGDFVARATPPGSDRFTGVPWTPGRGGAPLLTEALASLECEVATEHPGGDHWIVIGRVHDLRISPTTDPLIFFKGAFHALRDRTQDDSEAGRRTFLR